MPTLVPDEAGMGLPVQVAGESYPGQRGSVSGRLAIGEEGCVYVDVGGVRLLGIWPVGSELSQPVRLPDGSELVDGDELRGTGV